MAGQPADNERWESVMDLLADNVALLTAAGAVAAVSMLYACSGATTSASEHERSSTIEKGTGATKASSDKKKRKKTKKKAAEVTNEVEDVDSESEEEKPSEPAVQPTDTASSKKKKRKNKKKSEDKGILPKNVAHGVTILGIFGLFCVQILFRFVLTSRENFHHQWPSAQKRSI